MKGYPFIQFSLFLISGIIIGNSSTIACNDHKVRVLLTILIVSYISIYIIYIKTNLAFALKLWLGINAKLIIIVAGTALIMLDNYLKRNDEFLKDCKINYYEGLVISDKNEKPKYNSYNIEVKKIFYNDTWHKTKGKIILNIKKTSLELNYKYGNIILVNGNPHEVTEPKNSWEFNYKKYLKQQNIHYIHYANPEDILLTGKISLNPIQNLAYNIRDSGRKIFQTYIPGKQEYEVAAALVLGILGSLEKDLKLQYQKAGVIHVLAISGLHVLILFNLITFFLFKIKNKSFGKYIYVVTVLSVLWLFAFVAGLSPSVLRATVMFTFIVISSALHKKASVFNSLALSAFFLLLINPKLINDLGFQLSYLAVIGIAIFSTPIYDIFKTRYLFPNWLIKMIAATVAAQVATLPVLLYHFHVFPTWFIITNIFMIPGINLILYTSLVLLLISWQTTLANFTGQIIDWCLKVLHIFLYKCNSLPFAQINGLNIALWEAVIFYLMLVLFIIFLHTKKFSVFIFCITCLITLAIHQTYVTFMQVSKEQMVVYDINNTPVLSFITGKSLVVFNDSTVSNTLLVERINNHLQKEGINEIINLNNEKYPACIKHWKDYSFLIWKGRKIVISNYLKDVPTGSYDFIVLKAPLGNISINPLIKYNKIIGLRKLEKPKESEHNGSLFYNLKTSGTFISNL